MGVDPRYLGQLLRAYDVTKVFYSMGGGLRQSMKYSDLKRLPLLLPPRGEQSAIATFLDRETTKLDTLIAKQAKLLELLQEKRQALISHAVTKGLNPDVPMKDSGVGWLGEVPAHWDVVRLGILFREVSESGNDELPVLRVSIHDGVSDREFDEEELDRKVTRSEDRSKYKRVEPGDLVYNMMRAWQGGFGAVTVPGMVSPAYVVARPREPLRTDFIEQLLRTPQAVEKLRCHSYGVADFRLRLYWDEFKSIEIAIPPLSEQEQIMASISGESGRIDTLTEKSRRSIELMREHRTALISAAVTGKIDVREAS
jgi:type I restriction enzyme S subunit